MTPVATGPAPGSFRQPPASPSWDAVLFVWGVWALLLAVALHHVWEFGVNVPYGEEWNLLTSLTDPDKPPLAAVWSPAEDPCQPLPKLMLQTVVRLAGPDLRTVLFLNVIAAAGLAALWLLAARYDRGHTRYADAFLPLLLLTPGPPTSYGLWVFQLQAVLATVLAGVLLTVMLWSDRQLTPGQGLLAGLCLALLPVCGGPGLVWLPALALWLLLVAVGYWWARFPFAYLASFLVLGLIGVAVFLEWVYFGSWRRANPAFPADTVAWLLTSLQVFTTPLGPEAAAVHPYAGWGLLGVLVLSLFVLRSVWVAEPGEQFRVVSLFLFLAGGVLVLLAVGAERSGAGPGAGLHVRYAILAAPVLACVYFIWSGSRSPLGRLVQVSLFVLLTLLFLSNVRQARELARQRLDQVRELEADAAKGVPSFELAQRYAAALNDPDFRTPVDVAGAMHRLHEARWGWFAELQEPNVQEIDLALPPAEKSNVRWQNGVAYGLTKDASLTFVLERPRPVVAVRLTFAYEVAPDPAAHLRLSWFADGEHDFTAEIKPAPSGKPAERTLTIWVNATVDRLRLRPDDKPYVFRLARATLLVPAEEPPRAEAAPQP